MSETESSLKRKAQTETSQPKKKQRKYVCKISTNSRSAKPVLFYRPGENIFDIYKAGKLVRVFVPAKYFIKQTVLRGEDDVKDDGEESANEADEDRKVYGTDIYSEDSDLVAVAQHTGHLRVAELQRSGSKVKGFLVHVRIHKPPAKYQATFRNNVRSRSWTNPPDAQNNAYSIEHFKVIFDKLTPVAVDDAKNLKFFDGENSPIDNDALEQHRFLPNVSVVFNLANEPCLKYTLNSVADKGWNPQYFTSKRLQDEVLLVEAENNKYKLDWQPTTSKYKFTQIAPKEQVVEEALDWKDIEWGPESINLLKGKHVYQQIKNMQFFKREDVMVQ